MNDKTREDNGHSCGDMDDDAIRLRIASDLALIHSVVDATVEAVTGNKHGWVLMISVNGTLVMVDSLHIKDDIISALVNDMKKFRKEHEEKQKN